MKSNIRNSENTVLFLVSCFEYIFSGIILNAGRPFRQPTIQNCKIFTHILQKCSDILTLGRAIPWNCYYHAANDFAHGPRPLPAGEEADATDQDPVGLPALHDLPRFRLSRRCLAIRDHAVPLASTAVRHGQTDCDQTPEETEGIQVNSGGHPYVERLWSIALLLDKGVFSIDRPMSIGLSCRVAINLVKGPWARWHPHKLTTVKFCTSRIESIQWPLVGVRRSVLSATRPSARGYVPQKEFQLAAAPRKC